MSRRTEKLSQFFQTQISNCIPELQLGALVSVSTVDISPDCKNAKVYLLITAENQEKIYQEFLNKKHQLINALKEKDFDIKFFPHFDFLLDKSGEYSQNIDKLLEKI